MRSLLLVAVVVAPAALSAAPLTFDEAVRQAVAAHPSGKVAAADVSRAQALLDQARATYLPQLNLNAAVTQLDGDRSVGERVFLPATSANGNLQLIVPVLAFQRRAQAHRAADVVENTQAAAADVRRQVSVATARAFLAVVAQHRLVTVAEDALKTAGEHRAFAADRLAAGSGSEADQLRTEQEVATCEGQLANARGSLARAQEALTMLVGATETVDAVEPPTLPEPTSNGEPGVAARTDLVAAATRIKTSERATSEDWSDYVPLLNLIAQPFFQAPPSVTQPIVGWQAQLVLSMPLWDSGLRKAQQAERAAALEQARAQLAVLERQATGDLRAALAQLKQADEVNAASRRSAAIARRMRELSEKAFQIGATTSMELVDADQRLRQAESAVVIAEDQVRQARLELLVASGRFPEVP